MYSAYLFCRCLYLSIEYVALCIEYVLPSLHYARVCVRMLTRVHVHAPVCAHAPVRACVRAHARAKVLACACAHVRMLCLLHHVGNVHANMEISFARVSEAKGEAVL